MQVIYEQLNIEKLKTALRIVSHIDVHCIDADKYSTVAFV